MTKVDEACPLVEENLQSLYVSSYIKSKVRRGHMITWSVATGLRVSEMLFCVCRCRRWALGWVCRCLVCYQWRTTVRSWSWSSTVTSCFSPLYSRCSTLQTTIWMMLVKWRAMFVKMLCWDASRLLYCLWIGYRWLSVHLWMIMYLKLENWCITCIAFIYWLYSKNAVRSILQIRTVRLFKMKCRTFHGKYPFWNELLLIFKSKHY